MTGIPYSEAHSNLRRGWRDAMGVERSPGDPIDPQVAWLAVLLAAKLIPRRIGFVEPCAYFERDALQDFALALDDVIGQVRTFERREALEEARKATCPMCDNDWPMANATHHVFPSEPPFIQYKCDAIAIRDLAARTEKQE